MVTNIPTTMEKKPVYSFLVDAWGVYGRQHDDLQKAGFPEHPSANVQPSYYLLPPQCLNK
jgi:hypothetical protein